MLKNFKKDNTRWLQNLKTAYGYTTIIHWGTWVTSHNACWFSRMVKWLQLCLHIASATDLDLHQCTIRLSSPSFSRQNSTNPPKQSSNSTRLPSSYIEGRIQLDSPWQSIKLSISTSIPFAWKLLADTQNGSLLVSTILVSSPFFFCLTSLRLDRLRGKVKNVSYRKSMFKFWDK